MHAERDRLFERVFEESNDSAYLMDPIAGRILDANPAGCNMLEYTREELLATPVSEIHPAEHAQMREFVTAVHERRLTGHRGTRYTDVVNIGIGGSDLGPVMAYEALRHYSNRDMTFRFVSNVDGIDFVEATRDLVRKFLGPGLLGRLEECLRRAGHPQARRAYSLGS